MNTIIKIMSTVSKIPSSIINSLYLLVVYMMIMYIPTNTTKVCLLTILWIYTLYVLIKATYTFITNDKKVYKVDITDWLFIAGTIFLMLDGLNLSIGLRLSVGLRLLAMKIFEIGTWLEARKKIRLEPVKVPKRDL